jgi:pterin-4a-carbinolamine dehydratase
MLRPDALQSRLNTLNEALKDPWHLDNGKLRKAFVFASFARAFGFMAQVAITPRRSAIIRSGQTFTTACRSH